MINLPVRDLVTMAMYAPCYARWHMQRRRANFFGRDRVRYRAAVTVFEALIRSYEK